MSLEERVAQLEALVQKQQAMLAKSGEQILKLSVQLQRSDVEDLDRRNDDLRKQAKLPSTKEDQPDYFSQDDVVQLVEELQTQLDLVDKRSQLRVVNYTSEKLESVPGLSGEHYPAFPATRKQFEELGKDELIEFARFYELLPPDSSEILEMLQEAQIPLSSKEGKQALDKAKAAEASIDPSDVFNSVARYIGVSSRR